GQADGRRCASGRAAGTLRICDVASRRELLCWQAHAGPIRALAASSDGRHFGSAAADGIIHFWEWETGRSAGTFDPGLGALYALAWSGEGRRLAAAGERGTAVWDRQDQIGL